MKKNLRFPPVLRDVPESDRFNMRHGVPLEMCFSSPRVITPNWVILGQTFEPNYGDLRDHFDPVRPRLSKSLKVIGTDTDRSATYDFLLMFRTNYDPTSYHFRNKWQNLPNFPTFLYITNDEGVSSEFCNDKQLKKEWRNHLSHVTAECKLSQLERNLASCILPKKQVIYRITVVTRFQTEKKNIQTPHCLTYSRYALINLPQTLHGDRGRWHQ